MYAKQVTVFGCCVGATNVSGFGANPSTQEHQENSRESTVCPAQKHSNIYGDIYRERDGKGVEEQGEGRGEEREIYRNRWN